MLYLGGEDRCDKDILTGAQLYNRQVETNHTCMLTLEVKTGVTKVLTVAQL